jgi:PGF-CTERM protein
LTVGAETLSKTVSPETDQTVTVTFENATRDLAPGTYDVTLSGSSDVVSGTLTLSAENSSDGTSGDDGNSSDGTADDGESDGSGPGFGPGAGLAGIVSAGYVLKRRASNDETDSS